MRYYQSPRPRSERLAAQATLPPAPPAPVVWTMTEAEFNAQVEEARLSIEDACQDNPEVSPDDVWHDCAMSLQHNVPPSMRKEFRERLGIYL